MMKIIDKILDLINDKVLIILLEIELIINSILLNKPVFVALWLVCVILNIIVLCFKDEEEE